MKDNYSSLKLIAWLVVLVWAVAGLAIAWLCSWIWSLFFHEQTVAFFIVIAIYFVVSVIAAIIIGRAKLAQSSDA